LDNRVFCPEENDLYAVFLVLIARPAQKSRTGADE
jgi:hypothetical protein